MEFETEILLGDEGIGGSGLRHEYSLARVLDIEYKQHYSFTSGKYNVVVALALRFL